MFEGVSGDHPKLTDPYESSASRFRSLLKSNAMNTAHSRFWILLGLVTTACLFNGCISILNQHSARGAKSYQWAMPLQASVLYVDIPNGNILVDRSNQDTAVQAVAAFEVHARSAALAQEVLQEIQLVVEERPDGLAVSVRSPISSASDSVDLTLNVPAGIPVDLEVANGSIRVLSTQPTVEARTRNGRIEVDNHGGQVQLVTSNGQIVLRGAPADFTCQSSNGAIDIFLHGPWAGNGTVRTSNGRISVEGDAEINAYVAAEAGNGKVQMQNVLADTELNQPRMLQLHSQNGGIRVVAARPPQVSP